MAEIQCGWHMPSFAIDGNQQSFLEQVHATLAHIEGKVDSVWVDDHLIPWAAWQPKDTPAVECMTTIAYFAAAYPQLKFGSSVLCQSFRNPGLMAKMAANLQWLTGGRYIFGVGAGWMEQEYRSYNYEYPRPSVRIHQMEEAIEIARRMWTQSPASFDGTYYRIEDAYCEPRPTPAPPILIGGGGEQLTLRVVARHADWWNLPGGAVETYAHKLGMLRRHCAELGRDFDAIRKTWSAEAIAVAPTEAEARRIAAGSPFTNSPIVGTPEQVAEQLQAFVDIGVTYIIFRVLDYPATDGLDLFLTDVVPRLRAAA